MAEADLFDVTATNTPTTPSTPATPQVSSLDALVGEGKKYATAEDLVKAHIEANKHIDNIQGENKELREELNKRLGLEEFKTLIQANKTPAPAQPAPATTPAPTAGTPDLEDLVKKTLKEEKARDIAAQNRKTVLDALKTVWGDDARKNLEAKANELGLALSTLGELAEASPQALLNTLGVSVKAPVQTTPVPTSSVQIQAPAASQEKTYSFYRKMKLENPKAYYEPKNQLEMHRNAERLGEAFFDD